MEPAIEYLNHLLHQAVEAGADTVELQRVPEGLEISFLSGGAGIEHVLSDSQWNRMIISA